MFHKQQWPIYVFRARLQQDGIFFKAPFLSAYHFVHSGDCRLDSLTVLTGPFR